MIVLLERSSSFEISYDKAIVLLVVSLKENQEKVHIYFLSTCSTVMIFQLIKKGLHSW